MIIKVIQEITKKGSINKVRGTLLHMGNTGEACLPDRTNTITTTVTGNKQTKNQAEDD